MGGWPNLRRPSSLWTRLIKWQPLVLPWVAFVLSVISLVISARACRRSDREAEARGLDYTPEVRLTFAGRRAVLENVGARPILHPILRWSGWYLVDGDSCSIRITRSPGSGMNESENASESPRLPPRGKMELTVSQEDLAFFCKATEIDASVAHCKDGCVRLLESEAQYHGDFDGKLYTVRQEAVVKLPECEVSSLHAFVHLGGGTGTWRLSWSDPVVARAWACFQSKRERDTELPRLANGMDGAVDVLLQRERSGRPTEPGSLPPLPTPNP